MSNEIKFGTDGWRGIIADSFTFENVKIASQAIGKYILEEFGTNDITLIGFDTRFLSDKFAKACAYELSESGLKVQITNSFLPTPVIAFYAAKNKTTCAIQFTASHNPPEYCGLKYITNYGGPAPEDVTEKITEYIRDQSSNHKTSILKSNKYGIQNYEIATFNPKEEYINHLNTLINFKKIKNAKLKVVYDPIYGAGMNYLDHILFTAGCKTITIHNMPDPLFGGLLPEPKEKYLDDLKKHLKEHNADLGLATDGDADRLSAIDGSQIFYCPNKIASMLLRHLVKNKKLKGKVVRNLSTTHLLDHLAKKYNLETIETKVGFKWISQEMLKGNVLIGAEESGGISILNHIPDKDAILSGLLVVEMLAYEGKALSEIYKDTLKDANWNCLNDKMDLPLEEKHKNNLLKTLKTNDIYKYGKLKIKLINTTEGIKYILEDGSWLLIRPSGTEPLIRINFEATSDKVLNEMKNTIKNLIEKTAESN